MAQPLELNDAQTCCVLQGRVSGGGVRGRAEGIKRLDVEDCQNRAVLSQEWSVFGHAGVGGFCSLQPCGKAQLVVWPLLLGCTPPCMPILYTHRTYTQICIYIYIYM